MENGVVNLCNGHDRSIFEPMICCLKHIGPMRQRLLPDVKVVCLDFPEGKGALRPWSVAKLFRKERPDIVHTHGWGGGAWYGIIGARLANCPVVINGEHGLLFVKWHQLLLQRFAAALCTNIFSVSQALKEKVVDTLGIPSGSIKVITNGVDIEKFHRSKPEPELRVALGVDVGKETALVSSIGSLKPEKNQMMILKAVKQLHGRPGLQDFKLLLIGEGPDRGMLEQYVEREGLQAKVRFLGKREDVPRILSCTDVLVSTSNSGHEGLSNVILEAMASEVAVMATKSVGTEEIVADGSTGFLVDADDIASMADKLEVLIDNKAMTRKFGEEGRRIVVERYSLQRMISDYEDEYKRLCRHGEHDCSHIRS
jgi:glycosyltransferase involved in cell wall biosynthesis